MSKKALSLKKISVSIGGHKILSDISFELKRGEFVLLLGSNGAGKSTLIKAIMRDQVVCNGKITVGKVGLIAQDPRDSTYDDLTVLENCRIRTDKDCLNHLTRFLPRLADMMNRPVALLSGGERQVLALALCLLNPPDLLLLDEHTSALDPKTAARVMKITMQMVQEFGVATLMTTHNLEHAETYGTRILGIKRGEICFDGNINNRNQLLDLCYE